MSHPQQPYPQWQGQPDPQALIRQRDALQSEIASRRAGITAAETDLGRAVLTDRRAEPTRAQAIATAPELTAEINRIDASEAAIGGLIQQVQSIDAEAAAAAHAVPAGAHVCPVCRTPAAPDERFCRIDGEKLAPMPTTAACERCGHPIDRPEAYCIECGWRVDYSPVRFWRSRWFRVLLTGLALYIFCLIMLPHTGYAGALIVGELIVGAATVPLAFVTWFYERGTKTQTQLNVLTTTFLAGAFLGCAAAVILETSVHISGNWQYVPVGFIEEGCKLLIVLCWLRRKDLLSPDKGMLIGATTGMGFAALETMQYGFNSFLGSLESGASGSQALHAMSQELNVRGVLAPLGHGTWTGILAAVIWYQRAAGRGVFSGRTISAYVAISLLHALFDISVGSSVAPIPFVSGSKLPLPGLLCGLLGLATITLIVRGTHRGQDPISRFFDAAARLAANANQSINSPQPAYAGAPGQQWYGQAPPPQWQPGQQWQPVPAGAHAAPPPGYPPPQPGPGPNPPNGPNR